jgi:hypothetical protein
VAGEHYEAAARGLRVLSERNSGVTAQNCGFHLERRIGRRQSIAPTVQIPLQRLSHLPFTLLYL